MALRRQQCEDLLEDILHGPMSVGAAMCSGLRTGHAVEQIADRFDETGAMEDGDGAMASRQCESLPRAVASPQVACAFGRLQPRP